MLFRSQTNGSLRVEAVRKMSTGVDIILNTFLSYVKTVSGMSTCVDHFLSNAHKHVETVIKMSTEVDIALGSEIERLFETVSGMSTDID